MARIVYGFLVASVVAVTSVEERGWAQAQQAAARVGGTLTVADDGRPLRKATLTLDSVSPRLTRTTTSDGEGRWSFAGLPGGEYTLRAERPGYLESVYGARRPGRSQPGALIALGPGEQIDDLPFSLPRAGVIAGIVTDEYGDPVLDMPVRALRYAFRDGARIVGNAGDATTNDLGAYRIAGLMPGEYIVAAIPRETVSAAVSRQQAQAQRQRQIEADARAGDENARAALATMAQASREGRTPAPVNPVGYVPMYYPGTPTPSASAPVTVGLSSQVFGIDIRLGLAATARVEGTLLSAEGTPIQGNVRLVDPAMMALGLGAWLTSTGPDGRFLFGGIVPGVYRISGHNSPPGTIGGPPQGGGVFQMSMPQSVAVGDSDVAGVEVRMRPGADIAGRLDLATITAQVHVEDLRVRFAPVFVPGDWESPSYRIVPDPDGSFAIANVVPRRYRVEVFGLPAGWHLASAVFDGRDAADHLMSVESSRTYEGGVLTFTNRLARVSGVVTDGQRDPVPRFAVVLFPSDSALRLPGSRRIRVTPTGPDGSFDLRDLPAGEYRLAVVQDIEPDQEFNPEFLDSLVPGSLTVDLAPGQSVVRDMQVRR